MNNRKESWVKKKEKAKKENEKGKLNFVWGSSNLERFWCFVVLEEAEEEKKSNQIFFLYI